MERTPSGTFEDVEVWRRAHACVLGTYRLTAQFPADERYGLTAQLRRAAVSVPANIAEGFRRRSRPDKARFYNIAQGSLEECRYYLILARDLGYSDTRALLSDVTEVSHMLHAYTEAMLSSAR